MSFGPRFAVYLTTKKHDRYLFENMDGKFLFESKLSALVSVSLHVEQKDVQHLEIVELSHELFAHLVNIGAAIEEKLGELYQ